MKHINAAVLQTEVLDPELPLISGIPGLHFVDRDGCRLFPSYDGAGKVENTIAVMVAGDEGALPSDVGSHEEPFTFGDTIGIAIILKPVSETAGNIEVVDSFARQVSVAIQKLKQHVKDNAPL